MTYELLITIEIYIYWLILLFICVMNRINILRRAQDLHGWTKYLVASFDIV